MTFHQTGCPTQDEDEQQGKILKPCHDDVVGTTLKREFVKGIEAEDAEARRKKKNKKRRIESNNVLRVTFIEFKLLISICF